MADISDRSKAVILFCSLCVIVLVSVSVLFSTPVCLDDI